MNVDVSRDMPISRKQVVILCVRDSQIDKLVCPLCFSNQSQISFSLTSFASDSPVVLKDELLFSFSSICGGVKLGILLSSRRNGLDAI